MTISELRTFAVAGVILIAAVSQGVAAQNGIPGATPQDAGIDKPAVKGSDCKFPKSTVRTSAEVRSTSSQVLVDLPKTKLNFKTAKSGCVLVRLSADAYTSGQEFMFIEPLLDGEAVLSPGIVQFIHSAGPYADTRSFEWFAKDVPAGDHVVKFQYGTYNGTNGYIYSSTAVVSHR